MSPQDGVRAGGPLLTMLGFLILPFVWSVPEALITAELSTAFPENSGYVAWVTAAFGPYWGFQVGWLVSAGLREKRGGGWYSAHSCMQCSTSAACPCHGMGTKAV
jgi:hypothetical protein